jgi:hypothetical protein
MAVEYFTHTISRAGYAEMQRVIDEKVADGWEVVKEPTNTTKSVATYTKKGKMASSFVTPKYTCVVRKEKSKVIAGRNGL